MISKMRILDRRRNLMRGGIATQDMRDGGVIQVMLPPQAMVKVRRVRIRGRDGGLMVSLVVV